MMAKKRGSWRSRAEPRTSIAAGIGVFVLVLVIESAYGSGPQVLPLLALPPFVAATFAHWRAVSVLGMVCVSSSLALVISTYPSITSAPMPYMIDLLTVVLAAATAAGITVVRQRQRARWSALTRLASVAQQAVLRPIGPIGQLKVAGRYVSASDQADIGGDLYEAVETPYGSRMIIGDVRGKGLPAVRLASTVLGSFRHVAHERADIRTIVSDLDRAVARGAGYEDFVTAAFLELRGGTLTILNCGPPPPLLLRHGKLKLLQPPTAAPPLGFVPIVTPLTVRLEPGDRLLLYTDGLTEARRDGVFFPVEERVWGLVGHGSIVDGLASLESALRAWVGGPLSDDIALMLVEYIGSDSDEATSWSTDGDANTQRAAQNK